MTPLSHLEALEKAATAAPWTIMDGRIGHKEWTQLRSGSPGFVVADLKSECDAALIAESRNLLPALIEVANQATRFDWDSDMRAALRPLLDEGDAR